tara:strand:+ start:200 stop:2302 length:2103 start_codon:yes stop_codon:yes gene_type:complete
MNIGMMAVFCVPFVVHFKVFYPYTVPKAIWVHALNWLLLTVYLFGILFSKNLYSLYKPKLNFIFWLYGLYIFTYIISSIFGSNFSYSFWSDYQRMSGLYWHIHTLILFFILSGMLNNTKQFYNILIFIFFSGFVLSIFYLFEYYSIFTFDMPGYSDSSRVVFTFGNPGFAGLYFMLVFLIGLGMIRRDFMSATFDILPLKNITTRLQNILYFFYITFVLSLLIHSILVSASRSALMGILAGSGLFVFMLVTKTKNTFNNRNIYMIFSVLSILVLLLIGALYYFEVGKLLFDRINESASGSFDFGLVTRLTNFNAVFRGFLESPIFGYGMSNFAIPYNQFSVPSHVTSWEMDNTHNILSNILITGGIFVFIPYLLLITNALIHSFKNWQFDFFKNDLDIYNLKLIVILFFTGYFIHHMFWFDVHESHVLFILILAVVNFSIDTPKFLSSNQLIRNLSLMKNVLFSILIGNRRLLAALIIIIVPLLFINIELKIIRATHYVWNYGETTISSDYKNVEELDQKLSEKYINIDKGVEIFPPMANLARAYVINDGVQSVEKMPSPINKGFSDYAIQTALDAIAQHPEYWKTHARIGILYFEKAKFAESKDLRIEYKDKSAEALNKAIELGPSRTHVHSTLLTLYLWFDESDNAIQVLNQYKIFLDTIEADLDHNYYFMKSLLEFHDCNNYSDNYNILSNCISNIN